MKKLLSFSLLLFTLSFIAPTASFAQSMMGNMMNSSGDVSQTDDGHTAREEAEGKEIWEKIKNGELTCAELTDENFGALGEYFMGQMAGDSHESMNNMMIAMMGEEGEEEMHVAMGKRMSGCEPNASMPQGMMNGGMMQMMMGGGMMGNGWTPTASNSFNNPMSMMNFGYAPFGWIFMLLFWGLMIFGIIALIKWFISQNKGGTSEKSALDILKERYAKGEINKKEFKEKKKDLE